MSQSAARRCLAILELLAGRTEGAMLTEICSSLEIPKSIAHRLLCLLIESGFVKQDGGSSRYLLTLKLTTLGLRHYVRTGIDDLAQPVLDQLASETGELARLAVVEGERLIWVAKAQGARTGLRYDPDVDHDTGHDVVLHATATGKAWLATLPEMDALRIVSNTGFKKPERSGRNVVRSQREFQRLLRSTRTRGYGEAVEEGEPGTAAVAVAVLASEFNDSRTVATISLAGPVTRLTLERRQALAKQLSRAAKELAAIWPSRGKPALRATRAPQQAFTPQMELRHGREKIPPV